jgi:hypothetical protein
MTRRIIPSLSLIIVLASSVTFCHAQQFVARHRGREVVVHTNPIPVVLHRLIPPNVGRHVTLSEYQSGRVSFSRSPLLRQSP